MVKPRWVQTRWAFVPSRTSMVSTSTPAAADLAQTAAASSSTAGVLLSRGAR